MLNKKNEIVALVVLSTMLAVLAVGGLSLIYVQDRLQDLALDHLSETTKIYGEEMNTIITQVETVTQTLSNSVKGIINKERIDESYYYYQLSDELDRIAETFTDNDFNIMSIYVRFNPLISYSTAGVFYADINADGLLEKQKPTNLLLYDPSDDDHVGWFYKPFEQNEAIWIDPYYNANIDVEMLSYVAPLAIGDQVIGVVGVDINFDRFETIVKEGPSLGNAILLNQDLKMLVTDDMTPLELLSTNLSANKETNNGTFAYSVDDHDQIAGFSRLKNDWIVVVSLTKEQALANLNTTINMLLIVNLIVAFIMMIIAIFIGRRLNQMVLRNSELEQKVSERTHALTVANTNLNDSLMKLKETQKQLIISEKLAFLGELVSGIAHEINTPLGMSITLNSFIHQRIIGFKELLSAKNPSEEELNQCVRTMENSSISALENLKKVADIVDTFKQVSVDQFGQEVTSIRLKEHIQKTLMSISSKFENTKHRVVVNCRSDLKIDTFPGVLTQVLINLILNSLEHGFKDMDNGRIYIDVAFLEENNCITIQYRDTGHSLSDEDYNNIFDPFYTSTRTEGSIGLGLHIVHNLVTHTLKGSVSIERELHQEHGIDFTITLPMYIE